MKEKLLFPLFLLFASCTNTLDKKINPKTFSRDSLSLIQNEKYDNADFVFLKHYMKQLPADGLNQLKTYREVLDSAYNRRVLRAKMEQVLSVKVLHTSLQRKRKNKTLSEIYFRQTVEIKNQSKDTISGLMGYFYIINPANDTLNVLGFSNQNDLYPNKPANSFSLAVIFYNHDKPKAFDTISVDELNFLWSPQKVVFTNGEKLILKDSLNWESYFK